MLRALPPPVLAVNVGFVVFFGVFVVAFVVLSVITVRWAIRHDRAGRAAWLQRRRDQSPPPPPPGQ
jgi:uncharacterized membrane protein (DUF485 family)